MGYDGWIDYNGTELVNLSRTVQLTATLGIDTVWTTPESVQWIQDDLGGVGYGAIANAPWYVEGHPASAEFAGIVPLSFTGLSDSSRTASTIEFTGDGGRSGKGRSGTLPLVANVAIVASTKRGADYGLRWMNRVLTGNTNAPACVGADLTYFQYGSEDSPKAHRREVRLTRGASVTRERYSDCSATWIVTFTLTADDPYEYGEVTSAITSLGGLDATGPDILAEGSIVLIQESCPVYDYSPVYDPLYPALQPSPAIPDFYPAGWDITDGDVFERFWAKIPPVEPSTLLVVPTLHLTTEEAARMVRVSIWEGLADIESQCDPLFSVVISYLPPSLPFTVDGERKASYIWDGFSEAVRRTDSLVYAPDAKPVQWTAFNDADGLLVTLDVFADSDTPSGEVRLALDLTPKSD